MDMKKIFLKSLMFAGVSAFLLTACTEDLPERTPSYVPAADCMEVYFPNSNKAVTEVEQTVNSVEVTLSRVKTTSAASISLKEVDKSDVFTIPATVDFAAGQKDATITISFTGLEAFIQYSLGIQLDETYTNPYVENADGTTNFLLQLTQADWKDYANGSFNSWFFEAAWDQKLQYSETLGMYRFPDVWVVGYAYAFSWDGGASIVPGGTKASTGLYVQPSGYVHPTYGMIQTNTDASNSGYDSATKTFKFNIKWTVPAGSFGAGDETYTITQTL
jgi:hypothetical protein